MVNRRIALAGIAVAALGVLSCGLVRTSYHRGTGDAATLGDRREPTLTAGPRARADRDAIVALVREHDRLADPRFAEEIADVIYVEAREHGLDPLFVAAVTARESSFRPFAVSQKGAMGLMQIRPFVGEDVAQRLSLQWDGPDALHVPEMNIRLGVRYLVELLDRFDGDTRLALAAYHRGPTRLAEQLAAGQRIRSPYADRVLRLHAELAARRLHRNEAPSTRPWIATAARTSRNGG